MKTRELILRIVAVSLLVYSITSLGSEQTKLWDMRRACEELSVKCEVLRSENAQLTEQLFILNSKEGLEQQTRERLGMVKPGEKIFYFVKDRED